jgi:uncharacterized protein (TIGR03000 family)
VLPSEFFWRIRIPDYGAAARVLAQSSDTATIRVLVPDPNARVWFDDTPTQQSGSVRTFESPELTPGRDYVYTSKAQWREESGQEVTQTRPVVVRANADVTVDFRRPMTGEMTTGGTSTR